MPADLDIALLDYMRSKHRESQQVIFWPDPYYTKIAVPATKEEMVAAFRVLASRGDLSVDVTVSCNEGHPMWRGARANLPSVASLRACSHYRCEGGYTEDDEEPFIEETWALTEQGQGPPVNPPTLAEMLVRETARADAANARAEAAEALLDRVRAERFDPCEHFPVTETCETHPTDAPDCDACERGHLAMRAAEREAENCIQCQKRGVVLDFDLGAEFARRGAL